MSRLDPLKSLRRDIKTIYRILAARNLENSTVKDGMMRFVRGILRMEENSRLELYGVLQVIGQILLQGPMTVSGANAKITVGNVVIEPTGNGRITVGVGSAKVVLDGSTGKITAGNMTIDPTTGGGAVTFANGTQLYSSTAGKQIEMFSGQTHVTVREHTVTVGTSNFGVTIADGDSVLEDGIYPTGLPEMSADHLLGLNDGRMVKVAGYGDGGGGTPPELNPEGYIWPADPALYGISDNYAAHIARGSLEPGVDVMTPPGTPIYAPADGTVAAIHTTTDGATGRYVTLRTDGDAWFRILHLSSVAVSAGAVVAQGAILGYSGASGFGSENGYRPHAHITFWSGPSSSMPAFSATEDLEAYMAAQDAG
ncbi:M23 family metallopeptidase [Microbacterium rhizophilus]|uniref:M23 family metallopeptidase n=1 Tax=Microbacterium rhizophilus TaxID=3138934 RepID=UPI0031E9CDC2